MKILPLEYYKLDKAASLLNCEVDDLLHWGEIGAIKLCLLLDGLVGYLDFSSFDIPADEKITKLMNGENIIPLSTTRNSPYFSPILIDEEIYQNNNRIYLKGWASGLWSVASNSIGDIKNNGYADFHFMLRPDEHEELYEKQKILVLLRSVESFQSTVLPKFNKKLSEQTSELTLKKNNQKPIKISQEDLYISRYWVKKLSEFIEKGEDIPSFLSGKNYPPDGEYGKPAHGNIESSARKREKVYQAAIYWLINDLESCKGKRGSVTQSAWAQRIINGRNFKNVELGEDKIIECLRAAMKSDNED